jgi:hypothetical protein
MRPWREAFHHALVSGSAASVASAAALTACGALENGSASAPTNAVSHWVWGRTALHRDRPSGRFTLTGYAIHHAASIFWAVLYERYRGQDAQTPAAVIADAAALTTLACAVDLNVRPLRARPGFKARLSGGSLFAVYAAFAAGLAAATLAGSRSSSAAPPRPHRRAAGARPGRAAWAGRPLSMSR